MLTKKIISCTVFGFLAISCTKDFFAMEDNQSGITSNMLRKFKKTGALPDGSQHNTIAQLQCFSQTYSPEFGITSAFFDQTGTQFTITLAPRNPMPEYGETDRFRTRYTFDASTYELLERYTTEKSQPGAPLQEKVISPDETQIITINQNRTGFTVHRTDLDMILFIELCKKRLSKGKCQYPFVLDKEHAHLRTTLQKFSPAAQEILCATYNLQLTDDAAQ